MKRAQTLGSGLVLGPTSFVILSVLLSLTMPLFPHQQSTGNEFFIGLLEQINKVIGGIFRMIDTQ